MNHSKKNKTICLYPLILLSVIFANFNLSYCSDFENQCRELLNSKGTVDDSKRLYQLFDLDWMHYLENYPEWASNLGYPGYADKWTDYSLEAIEQRYADDLLLYDIILSIDRGKLNDEDRLNYDLFSWRMQDNIKNHEFNGDYLAINQMGGVQQDIANTLSMMATSNISDYKDIIERLRGVPRQIEQTIKLLEKGLASKITPPQVTLREVPNQILNQITDDPSNAPMLKPFKEFPTSIPTENRAQFRDDAYKIYTGQIVPSLKKLHSFVSEKYIPGCRKSVGMSDLPKGKAWYANQVNHYTTTDLTPVEIHNIGLAEVARIREEMEEIISHTNFQGDFASFCEFLRTDKSFYFESAEDLLKEYRDISKRIDPQLIKLFGHLPRLPYGVIPVPSYSEKSQTTAYYEPGSLEAGRPGYFYANTYDLSSRPRWEMVALTLHEAVPGHHLQIALANELSNLPEFRRYGWFTSYGEGWALYAESLGEEMGMYDDPYDKFGQLTYEMWRAIRLVVDVGMHYMGWSRQQAIDYFTENSCKAEHDIVVEVDRYIVWPGQALAYKIGELKIKELREYASEKLGKDFSLRAFHDVILGSGPLPLSVLETKVKEWVASKQKP
ncbi:MAG: DUF885 domain-containing protein [Gammaproteobacteria bacterium]